eukprot:SAG22_NODE_8853_length_626_cov_0.901328_2_plen_119_part_01
MRGVALLLILVRASCMGPSPLNHALPAVRTARKVACHHRKAGSLVIVNLVIVAIHDAEVLLYMAVPVGELRTVRSSCPAQAGVSPGRLPPPASPPALHTMRSLACLCIALASAGTATAQ